MKQSMHHILFWKKLFETLKMSSDAFKNAQFWLNEQLEEYRRKNRNKFNPTLITSLPKRPNFILRKKNRSGAMSAQITEYCESQKNR